MKPKIIIALVAAIMLIPAGALAAAELEIYYPEEGQVLLRGDDYRIRFTLDAAPYSFQTGAVFTKPRVGKAAAFARLEQTQSTTRTDSGSYSLAVNAGPDFGADTAGEYWLWVFAFRPDKTIIAGGYLPVDLRTPPQTNRAGWFTEGGISYYGRGGKLLTGWQEFGLYPITTRRYYFDENGAMQKGWLKYDNRWYYLGTDGLMQTGWLQTTGGDSYFLDPLGGQMYTHWQYIDGQWYYFHPDTGKLQHGWLTTDGGQYYLQDDSGAMLSGWQWLAGEGGEKAWFYFQPGQQAKAGNRQMVDGKWYYTAPEGGQRLDGWQQLPRQDDDAWYYLYEQGGYGLGWQRIGGSVYYFSTEAGSEGAMLTGWLTIGEDSYYLNPSGAMLTGVQSIDGEKYFFGSDGRLMD